MIYSSEADIVPFLKGMVQSIQPYSKAHEVSISFSHEIKRQIVLYNPHLLSLSMVQLICNIINLLPPKSKIEVRLKNVTENSISINVENNNINLIRVNEIVSHSAYSFTGSPLTNGTLYFLSLPLHRPGLSVEEIAGADSTSNNLPQFYKEVQKRLRSYFTQTEKLIAGLEISRPHEAAFMQKINTLIQVNLEDENFNTDSLCKAMFMSRTQLFRRLKSLIRQAPATYIKTIRLQKAKEMLETTDLTVSQIAYKTGFQSINHFTKIFKEKYGMPPTIFRQGNHSATNR